MQLLLITAIKEFESDVKNILVQSGAKSFTYNSVKGFKSEKKTHISDNWFASNYEEIDSLLFTVFVPQENIDLILTKIKEFNLKQEILSKIHIGLINLEQQF